jgi:hypothetical protein
MVSRGSRCVYRLSKRMIFTDAVETYPVPVLLPVDI